VQVYLFLLDSVRRLLSKKQFSENDRPERSVITTEFREVVGFLVM
jgi:hypothetical protein